jgi:hydrogenase expression/formation protein HypC
MCIAAPGRIVQIDRGSGIPMGTVAFDSVRRTCCLMYLPDADVGDYVIIQAGFAITILDESTARASLALFAELNVVD